MPRDIDLKRLRLFRQVAECGGLTAAETALNVNVSTISAHLSALEAQLGLRLCERGRGGFSLTEDGRAVLAASDRLLESVEQFDAELATVRQTLSGHLRVGIVDCTTSDPKAPLSRALAALKARSRDLELSLEIRSPTELERALLDQRLDLVIGPFAMATAGVEQHDLYAERLSLYGAAHHPVFSRGPRDIEVEDLNGVDYVARGYLRESQVLGRQVSFHIGATAHSVEGLAIFVLSGAFIGYLPDHYAQRWVAEGRMRSIRPDLFSHEVTFRVARLRERRASPAAEALIAQLVADREAP